MRREVLTFLAVGGAATLTHIVVATVLQTQLSVHPQLANFGGYVSAVSLSYFGHGRLTFQAKQLHASQAPKFIVVSLAGLFIGSALVALLSTKSGVRFEHTMAAVGVTVAVTTFLLSKFWVFSSAKISKSE